AQVTQSFGPVRNQYADVSRLGVDRWLAMVAAYQRSGSACMIVDAGTALTVDVLNDDGLHLGGYILPGLELMRSSLEQHTAIRLGDLQQGLSLAPGNSTNEAVGNGVNAAVVGAIRQALARLSGENDTVKLYVSGGDAPVLRPLLAAVPGLHVEEVQDLVFEGLALICPMD
ncbi:MAG: type III pantothenate kinase, partial [Gammaproteobacteria bacterium]